jgi:UDP-glucose 6-dehydrogenase
VSKVGIFGAGWVGLVTGACLAELGHEVVIRDVVPEKVEALRAGKVPFHEQDVPELLERNRERLAFTLDAEEVADGAEYLFVCVDTPPTYSGDADLSRVWTVVDELPRLDARTLLVMKSTVPVGTGEKVRVGLDALGLENVGYVSNPEFLAEGRAVADFMHPDRIVIGAFEEADGDAVEELYRDVQAEVVRCDVNSAEMIKLAANAFLMTRISFINEIANVCELTGADVTKVAEGVGLDHRLGPHFLRAGIGYGGSCLHGKELIFVRRGDGAEPMMLADAFDSVADGDGDVAFPEDIEVLAWKPGAAQPDFFSVAAVTRRWFDGELLGIKHSAPGVRPRCTPDHPLFIADDGEGGGLRVVLAEELRPGDWLPMVPVAKLVAPLAHRLERELAVAQYRAPRPITASPMTDRADLLDLAWVETRSISRHHFAGYVYSLEVPDAGTFVTNAGLVVHNCFPKDSLALKQLASNSGYHFQLLSAVIEVNELQKRRVVAKLQKHLGRLRGKRVALLGLAFKPHTDDMREAPSIVLASRLQAEGAEVTAWDPVAKPNELLRGVDVRATPLEAVRDADAAVIVTEWPELRELASPEVLDSMRGNLIVDGRNLLDPGDVRAAGFVYEGVGRPSSPFARLPESREEPAPSI